MVRPGGGVEERDRKISSGLCAEPDMGLNTMTPELTTSEETKSQMLSRLRYPGTPLFLFLMHLPGLTV